MEDLFKILSSSARLDKSKKRKRNPVHVPVEPPTAEESNTDDAHDEHRERNAATMRSRDRTGKRDTSDAKHEQGHKEQIAAFRRSMSIFVSDKHDPNLPDPIASFQEISSPSWWKEESDGEQPNQKMTLFENLARALLHNIEEGRWKEPTPIQMQSIPALLQRRDFIGSAPTGSGKSGAFILPMLLLSRAPYSTFYGVSQKKRKKSKKHKKNNAVSTAPGKQGEIRALLLAPSLELAAQLHREVKRLSLGIPGGQSSLLLSKANAAQVLSGSVGGKQGLDVLISTPLRLVDCIEKGLRLDAIRIVVLDEADRLLDAGDGRVSHTRKVADDNKDTHDTSGKDDSSDNGGGVFHGSGSSQSQTFLAQMDRILSEIPSTAVRTLFSATVTPTVRSLADSILRSPIDCTIRPNGSSGGANPDIEQKLMFVGREEGKLLAIRQIVQRGELRPPVLIFLQSQERAQALFGELLYDKIHVDVIHAGRSKSARENAVAKFRRGDTWVLICTDLVGRGVDFRAVNMVINYDLPESGISYIHRIGRTGRAGRKGEAITFFTEADFEQLRTIANIMKQSGCKVEEWMLNLPKKRQQKIPPHRKEINTTPRYDKKKKNRKKGNRKRTEEGEHN